MKIESGMTNYTKKKGRFVIKTYRQGTTIKGLGKTALQRMLTEFYFSKFFSNGIATKPVKMDLNKGETTFVFYDGIPLTSLLNDSTVIPKNILVDVAKIILAVSKNTLKTDKQSLKNYGNALQNFVEKSSDILKAYKLNKGHILKYNSDICNIFADFFDKQPEVITHGDFWLSNLLYNKKNKGIKLIDWEFADAGSIYLDLGTYYCYSLGFTNSADLFLENVKLQNHSVQLIRYFAIYRILRILSFVGLEDVQKTNVSDEYGLAYLVNVLKVLLENLDSFKLDSGRDIKENIDSKTKVAVFVISQNKKVLLLSRRADDKFPNMWEPPGGRKKNGETLLDAVKRELMEETGLIFDTGFKYFSETNFSMDGGTKNTNAIFFTIQTDEQDIELTEHEKYSWLSIDEAIVLVEFDFIKQSLEKLRHE
ncbi:MAG: NUDIX domain-containing protein [Candidatus Staskawiczbacteria bacterium]